MNRIIRGQRRIAITAVLAVLMVAGMVGLSAPSFATTTHGSEACPESSSEFSNEKGLLPDLQTVVPTQLKIQNSHQREILRFSNGIANRGAGDLRLRPEPVPGGINETTDGCQEILDAPAFGLANPEEHIVSQHLASTFEYHPGHNHWHLGDVALFEIRLAKHNDTGTGGKYGKVFNNDRGDSVSFKSTFCLIDWYRLEANSPTSQRTYFACEASFQGIAPGWVDQYHQSTEGQQLDVTGAPEGVYYLVSTANPSGAFLETDLTNNTAWTSFELSRDSKGNPKIKIISNSPCDTPNMCGEGIPNR